MRDWWIHNYRWSHWRLRLPSAIGSVLLLSVLALAGCGSASRAPVDELGGAPRFLDDGRTHRVNAGETLYAVAWMYDLDFAALARANGLSEPYTLTPGQSLRVDLRNLTSTAPGRSAVASSNNAAPTGVRVNPVQLPGGITRSTIGGGNLERSTLPDDPADDPADNSPLTPLPPLPQGSPQVVTLPEAEVVPATPGIPVPVQEPEAPALEPARTIETARIEVPPAPVVDAPISWAWPADGPIIGRFSESGIDDKGVKLAGERGDPVRAAADGQIVYAGRGLLRYGDLIIIKHNERFLSAYAHNDRILVQEGAFVERGELIAELGSSGIDRTMLHFEIRVEGTPVDPLGHLPQR